MHEATIAQTILTLLHEKLSYIKEATQVTRTSLILGEFRNIDEASLRFAFDSLKELYDGLKTCELEVIKVPTEALCAGHKHKYHPEIDNGYRCPQCDGGIGELIQGEEFHMTKIEIEKTEITEKIHA